MTAHSATSDVPEPGPSVELPIAVRPPLFTPEELADFKARVSPLIGLDLGAYKPRQLERRIGVLLSRANQPSLEAFFGLLQNDPARLKAFVDGLTINVTEFFRNPEHFEELRLRVLPLLLDRFERLRIWSAGCSSGAELYSVGILLEELGALERCELVGTDLDREILRRAEEGLFQPQEVPAVSPDHLVRYFEPEHAGRQRFTGKAIRGRCHFFFHNLLEGPALTDCHLILCRNVVIYFNDQGKQHLYAQFMRALTPGGVLFVGNTERLFEHRKLGLQLLSPFFYQKPLPEKD